MRWYRSSGDSARRFLLSSTSSSAIGLLVKNPEQKPGFDSCSGGATGLYTLHGAVHPRRDGRRTSGTVSGQLRARRRWLMRTKALCSSGFPASIVVAKAELQGGGSPNANAALASGAGPAYNGGAMYDANVPPAGGAVKVNDYLVEVCSACQRASCFQGKFLCDAAKGAPSMKVPVSHLRALELEHPSWLRVREPGQPMDAEDIRGLAMWAKPHASAEPGLFVAYLIHELGVPPKLVKESLDGFWQEAADGIDLAGFIESE